MNGRDYLTVAQLKYQRSCEKFKDIAVMHLSGDSVPEFERNDAVKRALILSLSEADEELAVEKIRSFFIEKYAVLPGVLNKDAGSITLKKCERFIKWFFEKGFIIKAKALKYCLPLEGLLIKGESDLLLKRTDGSLLYMDIRLGKNPYSDAARIEENKPSNSIELLARMSTAYFENADCCIAYLTSKKDRSTEIAELYEHGKGSNVAFMACNSLAKERLIESMKISCRKDCHACRFYDLCTTKPFEQNDYVVEEVKRKLSTMSKPTSAQERVIAHEDGPMVCTAIPGAGKTRVLVERMFRMIKEGKAPNRFFFATFTRKACKEIRDRIGKVVKRGKEPTIGTFHSIAYDILKEHNPDLLNKIATETVKCRLIEEAVKHCPVIRGVSYDYPALGDNGLYKKLMAEFDKIGLVGEEAYTNELDKEGILRAYDIYEKLYADGMYFEYDDMIRMALDLLRDENILEMYQSRWDYFMVDEFQDVSKEQAKLVMLLSGRNRNLLVVGDDDQSIYEWRNGTDYYLRHFNEFYPEAELVYMEDNFRTTAKILDAAESLIANNKDRYKKHINAIKEDGLPPFYAEGLNDSDFIELLRREKDFEPEEICILARKNADLERLAKKMEENGLLSIGPRNFIIDSKEFGLIKCFLNFAKNGAETKGQDLYRILKYCGISFEANPAAIYEKFLDYEKMPSQISCALVALEENGKEVKDILMNVFTELTGITESTAPLDALFDRIEEEGITKIDDVLKLLLDMERFKDTSEIEYAQRKGYYNLLTSHKAKGKEFPCVYIYGVEEYEETKEQRNLLYVSMTRAENKLVIVQRGTQLSPLINEIHGLKAINDYEPKGA